MEGVPELETVDRWKRSAEEGFWLLRKGSVLPESERGCDRGCQRCARLGGRQEEKSCGRPIRESRKPLRGESRRIAAGDAASNRIIARGWARRLRRPGVSADRHRSKIHTLVWGRGRSWKAGVRQAQARKLENCNVARVLVTSSRLQRLVRGIFSEQRLPGLRSG